MNLDQQRRYARQILLPQIGEAGQQKLLHARVLVIGAGGLGSASISYLAAAGIGTIGIADDDRVELSNLARQIIHETGDIGRLKVESASDRVAEINPDVRIVSYPFAVTAENAPTLITDYDLVADGCDNFATRFAVNDACVKLGIPLISAAVAGWQGQLMSVLPGTACYQCMVHPDAPEVANCQETGVVGPLVGLVGSMQALEVLRVVLRIPALGGKLALVDGRDQTQRIISLTRDPACSVCSISH